MGGRPTGTANYCHPYYTALIQYQNDNIIYLIGVIGVLEVECVLLRAEPLAERLGAEIVDMDEGTYRNGDVELWYISSC